MNAIRKAGGVIFWVAVAWIFIAGILALQFWPLVPHTTAGWVFFIVFGPPLYLICEAISGWLWSTRIGRAISAHPSSALRIFISVALGGTVLVIGLLISWHFGI